MRFSRLLLFGLPVIGIGVGAYFLLQKEKDGPIQQPFIENPGAREKYPVPKVNFTNITNPAGIQFKHVNGATGKKLLPETMGSGVAFVDVNNDKKPDLIFVNSCHWPGSNKAGAEPTLALYLNQGNGKFRDATTEFGLNVTLYGQGICVGDYDNDGFPDLFISAVGKPRLFHNVKGKKFSDATNLIQGSGDDFPKMTYEQFLEIKDPIPWGSSCTFLDYDGDGDLDLFVAHYVTWSPKIDLTIDSTLGGNQRAYAAPKDYTGSQCTLYENDGSIFKDVSKDKGVLVFPKGVNDPRLATRPEGKSLGVILCDPDDDGWPDIIVANDTVRNFFFHNIAGPDGKRKYEEIAYPKGVAYAEGTARGGMGIDWGQYAPDRYGLVIANFSNEPDTFLNLDRPKEMLFRDAAILVGLSGPSRRPLKFGTFFFDYDLDGRLDLLTTNGHLEPEISTIQIGQNYEQPAQLFWNTGKSDCYFEESGTSDNGSDLFKPIVGRGSAYADLDSDGDLDVVFTNNNGNPLLLRNDNAMKNNWIRLELQGDGKKTNLSAIGAKVVLYSGDTIIRREVGGARGYLSQSEFPITFGLGTLAKIDKVIVHWPGAKATPEMWTGLEINKLHTLKQGTGKRE